MSTRESAERDWRHLPRDAQPIYMRCLKKLRMRDPRVLGSRKKSHSASRYYKTDNVISVRASREHRVFITESREGISLVGFAHRSDNRMYKSEA